MPYKDYARESLATTALRTIAAAGYVEGPSTLEGVRVFTRPAAVVTTRTLERAYEVTRHSVDGSERDVFTLRRMTDVTALAAELAA